MKEQWINSTLEEVCEDLFAGGDVPKNSLSKIKTEKYNIPIFSNGIKNKGLYGYTDTPRVLKPSVTISARGTIGYSVIRKKNFFPVVRLIVLTPNTDILNINFLQYCVSNLDFKNSGSSIPQLTVPKIKKYEISIPSLEVQKQIVAILDKAFAAIDQAKANIQKNIQNTQDLFQSKLNQIFSQQEEGWSSKCLEDVCDGFQYGSSTKSIITGDVAVLRMGNITDGKIDWGNLKFSNSEEENIKYSLKHGDVLFNRTNSPELVGKSAIYENEQPAIFAGYLIRLRGKDNILDNYYLNFFLNSIQIREYGFSVMSSSVNQANINASKLKKYRIRFPEYKKQRLLVGEILEIKKKSDQLKSNYSSMIDNLEELKKSLLQKAFSGELTQNKQAA